MSLIWCTKHGEARGFQNQLTACVACHCRHRKSCKPYADMPLEEIAAAKLEASRNGHAIHVELPLFEGIAQRPE